jgi:hypothetical protein
MTALRWLLLLILPVLLPAQNDPTLDYYLAPARADRNLTYRTDVPTPAQFLGYEVGQWHVSHDQLVGYLRELDRISDRITLREYGRTHERRPLICLTITSPQNHGQLDTVRRQHRDLADPEKSGNLDPASIPAVVYMGYSIHGNEASGSNAALVVAYHLAAAQGAAVDSLLQSTVILLDPCFNPDGLQRFSTWVNSRRSVHGSADPAADEFNEPWPRGRTNHYWFDLNRDWLVAQQPETPGRLALLHDWKPNVLTDHHEMGSNATFFFQPGVPSRVNPLTPKRNQELTAKIAQYHADVLSANNILFFTGESYDDFFYGKGSTYPDVNGGIGILFEQASSRGSMQKTDNGLLTFPFTIRNQVFTTLSTLQAVREMRVELNTYLRDFYRSALEEAQSDAVGAYVVQGDLSNTAFAAFTQMLDRHRILFYGTRSDVRAGNRVFPHQQAGLQRSYLIPTAQPQYRLIKGIFGRPVAFTDSIFYDISAWTMPDAFGLEWAPVAAAQFKAEQLGERISGGAMVRPAGHPPAVGYAYLLPAGSSQLPRAMAALSAAGIEYKVALKPFESERKKFPAGTLLIAMANQRQAADTIWPAVHRVVSELSLFDEVPLRNGLTAGGPDLGSASFAVLRQPRVVLVTGAGINPADAGEAWHVLDQRLGLPVTLVEGDRLGSTNLGSYNVLILPDGSYRSVSAERVREFVGDGGTVIASGGALRWLKSVGLAAIEFRNGEGRPAGRRPYGSLNEDRAAFQLPGAIFEAALDLTHPLCFGYTRERLPMFLGDTVFVETAKNPYATPAVFTAEPLLAGYLHPQHRTLFSGAAAVVVAGYGRGRIVCFAGSPNFRGFWFGTGRLFANAVFFGQLISGESTERK